MADQKLVLAICPLPLHDYVVFDIADSTDTFQSFLGSILNTSAIAIVSELSLLSRNSLR